MAQPQTYFYDVSPEQEAPDRIVVLFEDREQQDPNATEREGRPIFKMRTFIIKFAPGDKSTRIERPVREEDKEKYKAAWKAYQDRNQDQISGTPLTAWPLLTRAQVAELKALNIFTVENLAGLPDNFAQRIMGAFDLRRKAQTFLEVSKNAAAFEAAKIREEAQAAKISALEEQVKALMEAQPKKRVGWPKGKPRKPKDLTHGAEPA